ncbi:uncharacterized protein LY79DRAFT_566306 [Colletotrichum navitas]|uniref:Uncharacterized protein n=1 Tax=Colletotrichum navitas TaxID=681940 RepID=A0AAD8PQ33_9PEZI|nr:uncharacterized protein LY79DRAFT_566306 [Colletotrichum navitas]KAK1574315.1 hypothetical protein LY79DRAFT_566306 [Colletotrichum navitas]
MLGPSVESSTSSQSLAWLAPRPDPEDQACHASQTGGNRPNPSPPPRTASRQWHPWSRCDEKSPGPWTTLVHSPERDFTFAARPGDFIHTPPLHRLANDISWDQCLRSYGPCSLLLPTMEDGTRCRCVHITPRHQPPRGANNRNTRQISSAGLSQSRRQTIPRSSLAHPVRPGPLSDSGPNPPRPLATLMGQPPLLLGRKECGNIMTIHNAYRNQQT